MIWSELLSWSENTSHVHIGLSALLLSVVLSQNFSSFFKSLFASVMVFVMLYIPYTPLSFVLISCAPVFYVLLENTGYRLDRQRHFSLILKSVSAWLIPALLLVVLQIFEAHIRLWPIHTKSLPTVQAGQMVLVMMLLGIPPFSGLMVDILNALKSRAAAMLMLIIWIRNHMLLDWAWSNLNCFESAGAHIHLFFLAAMLVFSLSRQREQFLLKLSYRTYAILLSLPIIYRFFGAVGGLEMYLMAYFFVWLWLHTYVVLILGEAEQTPNWETWSGLGVVRSISAVLSSVESGFAHFILFGSAVVLYREPQTTNRVWLSISLLFVVCSGLWIIVRKWAFFFGKPPTHETLRIASSRMTVFSWIVAGCGICGIIWRNSLIEAGRLLFLW